MDDLHHILIHIAKLDSNLVELILFRLLNLESLQFHNFELHTLICYPLQALLLLYPEIMGGL